MRLCRAFQAFFQGYERGASEYKTNRSDAQASDRAVSFKRDPLAWYMVTMLDCVKGGVIHGFGKILGREWVRRLKAWFSKATRDQLGAATEAAHAKVAAATRYPDFDDLLSPENLAPELLKLALSPSILANPDYTSIALRGMRGYLSADPARARAALECFVGAFRQAWEQQPAFQELRLLDEQILARNELERLGEALDESIANPVGWQTAGFMLTRSLQAALIADTRSSIRISCRGWTAGGCGG